MNIRKAGGSRKGRPRHGAPPPTCRKRDYGKDLKNRKEARGRTRLARPKGKEVQNEKGARPKGLGRKECLRIYDCLKMNKLAVNGGENLCTKTTKGSSCSFAGLLFDKMP